MVQPSLAREGFTPIPNVKLEDVGALDHARELFNLYILLPIKHPGAFEVIFNTTVLFMQFRLIVVNSRMNNQFSINNNNLCPTFCFFNCISHFSLFKFIRQSWSKSVYIMLS
jgi:hypothetical protein